MSTAEISSPRSAVSGIRRPYERSVLTPNEPFGKCKRSPALSSGASTVVVRGPPQSFWLTYGNYYSRLRLAIRIGDPYAITCRRRAGLREGCTIRRDQSPPGGRFTPITDKQAVA